MLKLLETRPGVRGGEYGGSGEMFHFFYWSLHVANQK